MDFLNVITGALFRKTGVGMANRALRHLIIGGLGTVFYIVLVATFVELFHIHPVLSAILAVLAVILFTYVFNRNWVYHTTQGHHHAVPRFLAVVCVSLLLNAGIMYITVEIMQAWYAWALVAATLIVPPTNFLLNFYWAFK